MLRELATTANASYNSVMQRINRKIEKTDSVFKDEPEIQTKITKKRMPGQNIKFQNAMTFAFHS